MFWKLGQPGETYISMNGEFLVFMVNLKPRHLTFSKKSWKTIIDPVCAFWHSMAFGTKSSNSVVLQIAEGRMVCCTVLHCFDCCIGALLNCCIVFILIIALSLFSLSLLHCSLLHCTQVRFTCFCSDLASLQLAGDNWGSILYCTCNHISGWFALHQD